MNNPDFITLTGAKITKKESAKHIPSHVQADTLFTFTTKLDYLLQTLSCKYVAPRYCDEDISYLKIGKKKMSFPMKCFCDINMHRLDEHLSWYGHYGLAFAKEWGMHKNIQPIQYINPESLLCKDFSATFKAALKVNPEKQTSAERTLKNFLLHQLMFYKPYSGKFRNRNTQKITAKCYMDECEWRFVPDVSVENYQQVYFDNRIPPADVLRDFNGALAQLPSVSLSFEYSDLKYVIVKTIADFTEFITTIESWNLPQNIEHELISKVLVWETSKGDF